MDLASSAGSSAKECLLVLSEATKLIDSFRLIYLPGNSKLTVYTELSELKNTLEALKTALLKYLYCQLNRFMPSHIILRITHVLSEVHSTLFDVNHALSVDSWDAKHLKVYQLDFLIAFQTHQLQEVFAEQYSLPSALLCTASSKDFWDTYFPTQWFVPWSHFWERVLQRGWAEPAEEKVVRHFLDFCADDFVSPYELCLFLKWFGQIEIAFKTLIMTLKSGLLVGAIPATEASSLLKGKMSGSFLVRFSKTRPGCFAVTVGGDNAPPRHFLLNYLEPGKFSMQHSDTIYCSIHNFVQMQPRLKYPVTTRQISDLMADVPTLRTSVEILTPMKSSVDILRPSLDSALRISTGSSGSAGGIQHAFASYDLVEGSPTNASSMFHHQRMHQHNLQQAHQSMTNQPIPQRSAPMGFGPPPSQLAGFAPLNPSHSSSNLASTSPIGFAPASFGFGPISTSPKPVAQFGMPPGALPPSSTSPSSSMTSSASSLPMGFGSSRPSQQSTQQTSILGQSHSPQSQPTVSAPIGFAPLRNQAPMGFGSSQLSPSSSNPPSFPHSPVSTSPDRNSSFFPPFVDNAVPHPTSLQPSDAIRRSMSQQLSRPVNQPPQERPSMPGAIRRSVSSQLPTIPTGQAASNATRVRGSSQSCAAAAPSAKPLSSKSSTGSDLFDDDPSSRTCTPLDICVICLDRERCTLFLDCCHMLCCTECSCLVSNCPICRQPITRVIPVYRS